MLVFPVEHLFSLFRAFGVWLVAVSVVSWGRAQKIGISKSKGLFLVHSNLSPPSKARSNNKLATQANEHQLQQVN